MACKRINHMEVVALRKIGNPTGFTLCGWEILDDDTTVVRMCLELPRVEGEKIRWTGEAKKACVTEAEVKAEEVRYEAETGMCADCGGTKETWAGWSKNEGNKYRPCRKCGATGKASAVGK